MSTARLAAMLIAACAATFIVTTSGNSLAPFLSVIATDTGTDLAAIAHLISFAAISWGACSWFAGSASDRIGRRPILIAAMFLLAATRFGFAHAQSYGAALMWHVISGVAGGAFLGAVFACVSDHVPAALRGRALGWVITGQSLSMVLGVPLLTYIGSFAGWRGAFIVHSAMAVVSALSLIYLIPPDIKHPPRSERHHVSFASIAKPEFMVLLGAGTMERMCFASLAIYFATYLQQSYHLPFSELAGALMLVALGNLIGNLLGGQLADRLPRRMALFCGSMIVAGILVIPLLWLSHSINLSIALGFAYSCANALGRPSFVATLSEVPNEVRGAVLGFNVTMASIGWLLAASVGAQLVIHLGFVSLGIFSGLSAFAGAALGWQYLRMKSRRSPVTTAAWQH